VSRIWLAHGNIAALADPATTIASAKQREPERQKLAGLLDTAATVMGVAPEGRRWRTGDLIQKAVNAPAYDKQLSRSMTCSSISPAK
jgi:hypothetical protein